MRMHAIALLISLIVGVFSITTEELDRLKDEDGIIAVTDANYAQISKGLEDYYIVLFITMRSTNDEGVALCKICLDFEDNYRNVVRLFQSQFPDKKVYFFSSDVQETRQIVRDMDLKNVPHAVVYPPKKDGEVYSWAKTPFYKYELVDKEVSNPLHFGSFLGKIMEVEITIPQEFDVQEFLTYFVICTAIFVVLKRVVLPIVGNKGLLFSIVLAFGILLPSIAGFKFTQINGIPFIARDGKGNIMFFSGGTGWQFGIEVVTVSAMYVAMSIVVTLLVYWKKLCKDNDNANVLGSLFCACLMFFFGSYYISCYKIKQPEYPFEF
ncbi:OST3 / OST6 family, transporter family [Nakaseomyces glabratus]|nr:OST3 / OST6 family, transporter family [Nakaseomyces glabratus]